MRAIYLLAVVFISTPVLAGVRERQYASGRDFFIHGHLPQYPFEAGRTHQEGEGRFRLYIDKSGRVTSVKTLQSTGHPLLDNAAVKSFMSFQARPGLRRETEVPVTFTMNLGYRRRPTRPLVVREFTD
jgi:TonB family protein